MSLPVPIQSARYPPATLPTTLPHFRTMPKVAPIATVAPITSVTYGMK